MRGEGAMAVIETAYRLDVDDRDWLRQMASLGGEAIGDPGMIVTGAIIRSHADGFVREPNVMHPYDEEFERTVASLEALCPARMNAQKYRHTLCASTTDLARQYGMPGSIARLVVGTKIGRWGGVREIVQVQGGVTDDLSVGLTLLRRDPMRVSPRLKHTWERVAMHMAAGYRLRNALRTAKAPALERAGLVLERSGEVAHASEPLAEDRELRERLRDCARAVDYARGRLAKDAPQQAVDLWQGLFAGRWSILETFDSDGRSYVIAIENEDDVAETRSLTRRERQVLQLASHGHGDDLIAYTIGISEATVQTHLQRALIKTNIKSRAALVRAAATLHDRLENERADRG